MAYHGEFTIATRLHLSAEHSAQLAALVRARGENVADTVTAIVAAYLDSLPGPATDIPLRPPPGPQEAQRLRHEISRLRAHQQAAGDEAPAWLQRYIDELESEANAWGD